MKLVRSVLMITAAAAAAACGGLAPGETVPPTVPPVCFAFASVQAQVATLKELDPETATYAEVQQVAVSLQSAWRQLTSSTAANVNEEGYAQLAAAIAELNRAAGQLPSGTTVGQVASELQDEIDAVVSASESLSTSLGCQQQLGS